jgi:hypothetical protein
MIDAIDRLAERLLTSKFAENVALFLAACLVAFSPFLAPGW